MFSLKIKKVVIVNLNSPQEVMSGRLNELQFKYSSCRYKNHWDIEIAMTNILNDCSSRKNIPTKGKYMNGEDTIQYLLEYVL